MYARVTTTRVQPGKLAGAVAIWREAVLPAGRQQPGFEGYLILGDGHTHQGIWVTLWATEADLRASATSGYLQDALAKFTGVFVGPLVQETYWVAYRTEPRRGESRYAGVATLQVQPGPDRADEASELWRRAALAEVQSLQGFEGLLLLLDREREQLLSIGLYATAAAARTVETSGHFEQVVALLRDLFVGQPTRQIYEVLLQG
jgi:heme-degrading monooxygenase HmoA